jgi:hypothetical protein
MLPGAAFALLAGAGVVVGVGFVLEGASFVAMRPLRLTTSVRG